MIEFIKLKIELRRYLRLVRIGAKSHTPCRMVVATPKRIWTNGMNSTREYCKVIKRYIDSEVELDTDKEFVVGQVRWDREIILCIRNKNPIHNHTEVDRVNSKQKDIGVEPNALISSPLCLIRD